MTILYVPYSHPTPWLTKLTTHQLYGDALPSHPLSSTLSFFTSLTLIPHKPLLLPLHLSPIYLIPSHPLLHPIYHSLQHYLTLIPHKPLPPHPLTYPALTCHTLDTGRGVSETSMITHLHTMTNPFINTSKVKLMHQLYIHQRLQL